MNFLAHTCQIIEVLIEKKSITKDIFFPSHELFPSILKEHKTGLRNLTIIPVLSCHTI